MMRGYTMFMNYHYCKYINPAQIDVNIQCNLNPNEIYEKKMWEHMLSWFSRPMIELIIGISIVKGPCNICFLMRNSSMFTLVEKNNSEQGGAI